MIDLYCERLGPGLGAEPLNALTNLCFIVAAAYAWREAWQRRQGESVLLAALIGAIGVGSGLFHTFATPWAQWLDVMPILAFELLYFTCYLRRLSALGAPTTALALLVFMLCLAAAGTVTAPFNGSLAYLPALLALLVLGGESWRSEGHPRVLCAALLFAVSLTARSVDLAGCTQWPYGTHFIWHTLNAVMLYLLMQAYMRSPRHPANHLLTAHHRA